MRKWEKKLSLVFNFGVFCSYGLLYHVDDICACGFVDVCMYTFMEKL